MKLFDFYVLRGLPTTSHSHVLSPTESAKKLNAPVATGSLPNVPLETTISAPEAPTPPLKKRKAKPKAPDNSEDSDDSADEQYFFFCYCLFSRVNIIIFRHRRNLPAPNKRAKETKPRKPKTDVASSSTETERYCKYCNKTIGFGNGGEANWKEHEGSEKH
ncbi:hypothetical protein B0H10DRAFT_1916421, partial [Mycena sp. CBHHK59/15]